MSSTDVNRLTSREYEEAASCAKARLGYCAGSNAYVSSQIAMNVIADLCIDLQVGWQRLPAGLQELHARITNNRDVHVEVKELSRLLDSVRHTH